ncbi:MAG: hypothetical protein KF778_23140 [Rhodocyclaceae bacterium]|nr:hypothetical protein [Rhodocyclaceae bacterium]
MFYSIEGVADVFADACLADDDGRLMFISVYGRDGAIQHFISALALPRDEGGLATITLARPQTEPASQRRLPAFDVGDHKRLTKYSGRLAAETLFGTLVHAWIYDRALARPDHAARRAWVLMPELPERTESFLAALRARAWQVVKGLSPVPLLDHWQDTVLHKLQDEGACVGGNSVGTLYGMRITLPETFAEIVSGLVKRGAIGLDARACGADEPLAAQAVGQAAIGAGSFRCGHAIVLKQSAGGVLA